MEKTYLENLETLKKESDKIPNTYMMMFGKVIMLVILNMRYELIIKNRNLKTHPYLLTDELIKDSLKFLHMWKEINFIEDIAKDSSFEKMKMEEKHKHLFQKIWKNFNIDEYKNYIDRYIYRLQINDIDVKDLKCIDCGCGNGNFAHALIHEYASYVYAIDFGKDSIEYAKKASDVLNITSDQIEFKTENVYNISKEDNTFDFAIQNGVFHHLEDEDKAYKEVWRVLKPNAWFWVYTDGGGGISYDLWDASVYILRFVNHDLIIKYLDTLNLTTNKKCHLSDALVATYRHTTYKEIIDRLSRLGFGNFRRLVGGFDTDFDYDVIEKDKYGKEKFGDGDLRILAQKII